MKKGFYFSLAIIAFNLCLALGVYITIGYLTRMPIDGRLKDAEKSYHSGELSTTIYDRKQYFNQALELYLGLEHEYRPTFGDGKLYYNIGNTYFQLEEYPWAILYYEKAKALMPLEQAVKTNLLLTKDKLSLASSSSVGSFADKLFLTQIFSLPRRLEIFFWTTLFFMVVSSIAVWKWNSMVKVVMGGSFAIIAFMSATLLYSSYFAPINGVIIESALLRRDAGEQYAKVIPEPLPAGSLVEVIGDVSDRPWVKVIAPQGSIGYIDKNSIRTI